ncbi:MAG: hypothetical protein HRT61_21870, partial [Ekhidna sp.]|nr:hypothetical protein [Ekhidna sp.]
SMFTLWDIITRIYPELVKDRFVVAFESSDGNMTELFDQEQVLLPSQTTLHILPASDGSVFDPLTIYIIIAIVSAGAAILLAPKAEMPEADTAKGANWSSPENVVGQGGVIPVVLGLRKVGSRVASQGIGSTTYIGSGEFYG